MIDYNKIGAYKTIFIFMLNKTFITSSAFLHDILNPITAVKIILEQLLDGVYGHTLEDIRPVLEAILQTNNRVSYLLESQRISDDNILDINLDSLSYLDLCKFLQKLHLEYLPLAKFRNIKLHYEINTPLIHGADVIADSVCLSRMLSNLIQNAIKYTATGDIFIKVLNLRDDLVVEIEDTGKGIAPQELQNIFLPFYQAHTKSLGSGLGLYVVRMIAKAHGLKLLVDSKEGEGTKFTIIFPYRVDQPYGLDGTIQVSEWEKNALLK
ncbi:HAMP domain-containing sensor histidine kinase [Nodularia spumigena CS-586/05]|nr:HAMP domain-containing sensor histidine kinase [Nodularia spumigena CS-586/05]